MAIYITGDLHGEYDMRKLTTKYFPEGLQLTKKDYVIICGDFGGVWDCAGQDRYVQNWLGDKPWTTLFVDGNHENFDALAQYPIETWNGGNVQFIQPDIIHLMRGQVYNINGLSIFTMGGATSIDKYCRTEGRDWWPQEMPSNKEYEEAFQNLDRCDNKVDLIITHCAPDELHDILTYKEGSHTKLTNFLQVVYKTVKFDNWYLGHYHQDQDYGKFHVRYQKIDRLI